jgi:hypothetical protein
MRGKQFGKGRSKFFPVRCSCSGREQIGALEGLVCSAPLFVKPTGNFYFAGESGKKVAFLNGKWHENKIMVIDRHSFKKS